MVCAAIIVLLYESVATCLSSVEDRTRVELAAGGAEGCTGERVVVTVRARVAIRRMVVMKVRLVEAENETSCKDDADLVTLKGSGGLLLAKISEPHYLSIHISFFFFLRL